MQNYKGKVKDKILFIDTSDSQQIQVALENDGEKDTITQQTDRWKAQIVLPLIQQLLCKHKLTFQGLTAIRINKGPGSFTGLRVGVSIANALGTWLHIPINNKKIGEIEEPMYE